MDSYDVPKHITKRIKGPPFNLGTSKYTICLTKRAGREEKIISIGGLSNLFCLLQLEEKTHFQIQYSFCLPPRKQVKHPRDSKGQDKGRKREEEQEEQKILSSSSSSATIRNPFHIQNSSLILNNAEVKKHPTKRQTG